MDNRITGVENTLIDLSDIIRRIEKSNDDVDNRICALHKHLKNIQEQEDGMLEPIRRIKNNIILLEQINIQQKKT